MFKALVTYVQRILRSNGKCSSYCAASNSRSQLEVEAAQLRAALESGSASEDDVSRWIGNDPERIVTYERIAGWSSRLDRLLILRPRGSIDPDLLAPEASKVHLLSLLLGRPALSSFAAIATVVAISLAVFLPSYLSEVATGVGERRQIVLEDGSTIELNTSSTVSVHFKDSVREVLLHSGEAMFNVAKDINRPFRVITNERVITAVGTAFSVRRPGEVETHVVVDEGVVAVSPQGVAFIGGSSSSKDLTYLMAGTMARFKEGKAEVTQLNTEQLAGRLAWRNGFVSFDGEPISVAIEEFNRYHRLGIVVAPDIRSIRVGGYFKVSDREGFVRALALTFGIETVRLADGTLLLQRSVTTISGARQVAPSN